MKSEFVVCVEEVEGGRCLRVVEGCRIPAHAEKLSVTFGVYTTLAKPNSHFVPAIHINDNKVALRGFYGARVALVSEVAEESERIEGCSVEEPVLPALRVMWV